MAGGVQWASDPLSSGLDDHPPGGDLTLEEVQEGAEVGRADGVGAAVPAGALVADPVEHELNPVGGLCLPRRSGRTTQAWRASSTFWDSAGCGSRRHLPEGWSPRTGLSCGCLPR